MKRKQKDQIDSAGEQLSMFDFAFDNENAFSRQQTINILDAYLPQIRRAINNYVIDAITMRFQNYPSGLHDIVAEIDIKNGDAYKKDILSLCLDTVTIAQTSLLKTLIKHIRVLTEYNYGERFRYCINRLSDEDMLAWLTSRKQSYLRNNIVLLYNHSWLWGSGIVDQYTSDDLASDDDKVFLVFKGTFEISRTLIADWILYARDLYKKDLSRRAKGIRKRRHYTWTSILRRKRDKIGIKS